MVRSLQRLDFNETTSGAWNSKPHPASHGAATWRI